MVYDEASAAGKKISELTESLNVCRQQLEDEKAFAKWKITELEEMRDALDTVQSERDELNDRLSFIASAVEAEPEQNSGLEEFRSLLDNDYQKYASQNAFHSSGVGALRTLQEAEAQIELLTRDPQILGKTVVAVGGAFSSGKSSFMNSLFLNDRVTLPTGMDQTTAIASYVLIGGSTEITGYTYRGGRISIPEKIFQLFTYRHKDEFRFNMKRLIDDIVFRTEFIMPAEGGIPSSGMPNVISRP